MKQGIVVPTIAAIVWTLVMYSGLSNGALFVRVFIVANLAVCIVFVVAAGINLMRLAQR